MPNTITSELAWQQHAACLGADPRLFFPSYRETSAKDPYAQARIICTGCPVRTICLETELDTVMYSGKKVASVGMFGGKSPRERLQIVAERRKAIYELLAVGSKVPMA